MAEVTGGATPGGGDERFVRDISAYLLGAKGWMKFLGVLMIIWGILLAITVVGLILCWLPIWMGVLLFRAASALEAAQASGSQEELRMMMSKLKTYFTITGIFAAAAIVFMLIAAIVGSLTALIPFMSSYGY